MKAVQRPARDEVAIGNLPSAASTPKTSTTSGRPQDHSPLYEESLRIASRLLDSVSQGLRRVPQGVRYAPADMITLPLAHVWSRRETIARNYALMLDTSLGDPRVWQLTAASIRNFGHMSVDFLRTRTMPDDDLMQRVTRAGEDAFREVRSHGRGVIFALPHAGCWDVAAVYARAYGAPITVVTEDNWATQLVAGSRADRGITLAPRDRSLRQLFRALRHNECVVMLADLANAGVQTTDVPFFGRPAPFPDGPARLSQRTGAPIMVVTCVRRPGERYYIEAQPPISVDPALSADDAIVDLTARMVQGFERVIKRDPDQWYPFHPVWPESAWR